MLAGVFPLIAWAQPSPAPVRTLLYAFESRVGPAAKGGPDTGERPAGEIAPDDCLSGGLKVAGRMSSQIAAGNGGIDWFQTDCTSGFGYKVGASSRPDRGSITIGMLGKQTDGSLVLQIAETQPQRDATSATCVVYPTTALVCDPGKPISLEEATLMRFLAPGVVDPQRDRTHWQMQDGSTQSSFTATFAILRNAGGVMTVAERRAAKGEAGPYSTDDSNATFTYDVARAVPTAIDDTLVQKTVLYGQYRTMERETLFSLQPP